MASIDKDIDIDLNALRVRRSTLHGRSIVVHMQDPAGIFDLIEVVGTGTYGQVYKVSRWRRRERFDECISATSLPHWCQSLARLNRFTLAVRNTCASHRARSHMSEI